MGIENLRTEDTVSDRAAAERWGKFLMLPLVAGLIVLCAVSWEWKETLKARRVIIEGASMLPVQQILSIVALPTKAPLRSIDLFALRGKLLANPFIRSAAVRREYPDAIRISITERKPVASFNSGQLWYVDDQGVVLPYVQSPVKPDLPVIDGITGGGKPIAGDTLAGSEMSQALEVLQTAEEVDSSMLHFISEINMNGGKDIILYSTDVAVPIVLGRGDYGKKFVLLETFWKNFVKTENAGSLQYIDLRYDDQVVVRWQNDGGRQTKVAL